MNAMVAVFLLMVVLAFAFYMYGDVIMDLINSMSGNTDEINICSNWALRGCDIDYYNKNAEKLNNLLGCTTTSDTGDDYKKCRLKCPECGVYA